MKMIIGGAVAFLLGIFTIIMFSASFFDLVLGVVPVTLILAGCLMIYLNRETLLPKKDHDPPVEEPVIEESIVEAPAAEKPAVEAPVVEETVIEVSPAEEPLAEEPVIEVPPAEETIIEKPVMQESKFVGNTESKIFHKQDCNFAQSKKCTDYFATTEEAFQAGYKPCSRCNP